MSDNESQLTRTQVAKNQPEKIIKQKLDDLSLDKDHSASSSLSSQEITEIQSKNVYFNWARRGRTIGIEISEDYYNDLLEEINYLEREKQRAEATLMRLNDGKNKLEESLRQPGKTKRSIRKIEAQIKNFNANIACAEEFKSHIGKQLQITDEKLGKIEQLFEEDDSFVALATIPETASYNPKSVILTYSIPSTFECNGVTRRNSRPLLMESLQQSLTDSSYIESIKIGEEKEGIGASIQVAQVSSDISQEDSSVSSEHKPNSWTILAAKDEVNEFKGESERLSDDRLEGSMAKDVIKAVKENSEGTFVQTQLGNDDSNESYVRVVSNIYKTLGGTVLSSFHYVKRPSKSNVFKFVSKRNKGIFQFKANDFAFESFTTFAKKGTEQSSPDFTKGNTVNLDYKQAKLQIYQEANAAGVQNGKNSNYTNSVTVQGSAKKAIDLKNKKFAALPSTINFGS